MWKKFNGCNYFSHALYISANAVQCSWPRGGTWYRLPLNIIFKIPFLKRALTDSNYFSTLAKAPSMENVCFCPHLIGLYYICHASFSCVICSDLDPLMSERVKLAGNPQQKRNTTPELFNPPTILCTTSVCIWCGRQLSELTDLIWRAHTHTHT